MNHHDVFLRWLSVRGAGSWDTFRSSHAWLFGSQVKPTWTARSLQELGHLEIDWEARRWAIDLSDADIKRVQQRALAGTCVLGLRFSGDRMSPPERLPRT